MELRVNDYVRTEDGLIAKIINIDNTSQYSEIILKTDTNDTIWCSYEKDLKSRPNIIDLIEIGDYVNGEKVIRLFNPTFISMGELPYVITDKSKYEPQEIKSIVTKECFESMEYRL